MIQEYYRAETLHFSQARYYIMRNPGEREGFRRRTAEDTGQVNTFSNVHDLKNLQLLFLRPNRSGHASCIREAKSSSSMPFSNQAIALL